MNLGNPVSVLETFYENQMDIASDGQAPAPMTDQDYIREVLVDSEDVDHQIAKTIAWRVSDIAYAYADTHELPKVIRRGSNQPDETIVVYVGQDPVASFGMGKYTEEESEVVIMGIQARYPKAIWL